MFALALSEAEWKVQGASKKGQTIMFDIPPNLYNGRGATLRVRAEARFEISEFCAVNKQDWTGEHQPSRSRA